MDERFRFGIFLAAACILPALLLAAIVLLFLLAGGLCVGGGGFFACLVCLGVELLPLAAVILRVFAFFDG